MTGPSWDDLLATALVGTERRGLAPTTAADLAAVLGVADLGPLAVPAVEHQVLAAAGVLSAWRRAGWRPRRGDGPPPEPAPADDRPVAPPAAVQLLELLLAGQVPLPGGPEALVGEWLERCAAAGRRPPDALLPRLLAAGTSMAGRRDAVVAAGGPRLRWLASRNPAWAWAAGGAATARKAPGAAGADAREWATGDRDARARLLARLRRDDPAAARTLVEGTWSTEAVADRARFLELFATGLGDEDEPFLETALDDRGRTVRAVAAGLLASLPSSRLATRMAGRLAPLVRVGGRLRRRMEVEPPDDLDRSARRDGVTDEGAPAGTGRRAWWLVQLVGAAPLGFWEGRMGAAPEEVVRLGRDRPELRAGWVRAAARQRDATWARLLLRGSVHPELLAVLPAAAADAELVGLAARVPDAGFGALVHAAPGPWSPPASRAVLARARALTVKVHLAAVHPVLAARLDPATLPEVERWIDALGADEPARRQVRALAHTLSIRAAIAQELP